MSTSFDLLRALHALKPKEPTAADAARLLRELEEKAEATARARVLVAYRTAEGNALNGSVVVWRKPDRAETEMVVQFTLNGQDIRRSVVMSDSEFMADASCARALVTAVADEIALALVVPKMAEMLR